MLEMNTGQHCCHKRCKPNLKKQINNLMNHFKETQQPMLEVTVTTAETPYTPCQWLTAWHKYPCWLLHHGSSKRKLAAGMPATTAVVVVGKSVTSCIVTMNHCDSF